MPRTRATAVREAIASLTASSRGPLELPEEARTRIARVVPNDAGAWMLTDPQTTLPISVLRDGPIVPEYGRRCLEHERLVPDFVPFARLHRAGVVATTLLRYRRLPTAELPLPQSSHRRSV